MTEFIFCDAFKTTCAQASMQGKHSLTSSSILSMFWLDIMRSFDSNAIEDLNDNAFQVQRSVNNEYL
jgi:hypothetical protein